MSGQQNHNDTDAEEEEEENAMECKLPKVFQNAEVVTNTEAAVILTAYIESKKAKDTNYQLHPMLKLAKQYAERFSTTKNKDVIQQMRELLVGHNLNNFETGAVANLCPENAQEAKALVPSMFQEGGVAEEEADQMLSDLAEFRRHE